MSFSVARYRPLVVIHSTHLFRFLKFHENRASARTVLKEKGFKRIKIGIEGSAHDPVLFPAKKRALSVVRFVFLSVFLPLPRLFACLSISVFPPSSILSLAVWSSASFFAFSVSRSRFPFCLLLEDNKSVKLLGLSGSRLCPLVILLLMCVALGFPTYAEKIRTGPDGDKLEVVYNYEQRVFIKLSWEREDSKSRHVDFQCVRARAPTSLATAQAT